VPGRDAGPLSRSAVGGHCACIMSHDKRGCLGAVYRITAEFLEKRGLKNEVMARLTPASRKLLERPPFPFSWQDALALEEIEEVLHERSPQLAAELGYAAADYLSNTLIAPVFKMAVTLFGKTPDALFQNLDRFYSMAVRGFSFRYEAGGRSHGTVFVKISGGRPHESLFQQIRGNLRVMYNICGATGTIGEPSVLRSDDTGAEVSLPVAWG
jgi:hypothetical protein